MTALVPTQADREAVAAYIRGAFGERYVKSVLHEGRWPDLVQAFAGHAEQARLAERERCAKVAEEHMPDATSSVASRASRATARAIATAIRQGEPK